MSKPLYCYKIDEKNAIITKTQIDNYQEKLVNGILKYTYFETVEHTYHHEHAVTKNHIDKVSNMMVYSFNDNIDDIISIVNNWLVSKRDAAYKEYDRWNELIIHLNKNQQK